MKNIQKGFTLVELMITVAIIGILASIAIPAYQNFVIRAKVSEGIMLASSYKTILTALFLEQPSYFNGINACTDTTSCDRIGISYVSGFEKVASISTKTTGKIIIDYSENVVPNNVNRLIFSPQIAGVDIDLSNTPNSQTIRWQCRPALTNGIDFKYIPVNCRNAPAD